MKLERSVIAQDQVPMIYNKQAFFQKFCSDETLNEKAFKRPPPPNESIAYFTKRKYESLMLGSSRHRILCLKTRLTYTGFGRKVGPKHYIQVGVNFRYLQMIGFFYVYYLFYLNLANDGKCLYFG